MDITYVKAVFGSLRKTTTPPLYRDDHDLVLRLVGIRGLPEYFQAHFANQEYGTAVVMLGHDGDVTIPNTMLSTGLPVYCWVIVENDISGRVIYTAKIPVRQKARPDGTVPQEQAGIISQAISALNDAGTAAQEAADSAAQSAADAADSAASALSAKADAQESAGSASTDAGMAEAAATIAENAADSAVISANSANRDANRAEMAANNAGYFEIGLDARDHLIYTRTDAVNVDFDLTESGHLIMEVI